MNLFTDTGLLMNLANFDLNLLKTLLVLLQEKNTNRAAECLGTSQPAVSRTLAKLREELGDPLFIRHSRGLTLSARAEQLAKDLPELMKRLEQTLEDTQFDPSKLTGKLTLALNGFLIESYGYQIFEKLREEAPKLQLDLLSYTPMTVSDLASGEIDGAINYYPLNISKELRQVPMGMLTMGLICRAGHPLANKVIGTADVFDYDLTGLIIPDHNLRDMVARKYADAGVKVTTRFRSQQLSPVLNAVEHSNMLFIAPVNLMQTLDREKFAEVRVNCDREILEQKLAFIYNHRYSGSPKYAWLESLFASIIS